MQKNNGEVQWRLPLPSQTRYDSLDCMWNLMRFYRLLLTWIVLEYVSWTIFLDQWEPMKSMKRLYSCTSKRTYFTWVGQLGRRPVDFSIFNCNLYSCARLPAMICIMREQRQLWYIYSLIYSRSRLLNKNELLQSIEIPVYYGCHNMTQYRKWLVLVEGHLSEVIAPWLYSSQWIINGTFPILTLPFGQHYLETYDQLVNPWRH